MSDAPAKRPWVKNGPEDRLSIVFDRLLTDCLLQPCYFTANNDSDHGGRTNNQRSRDINRGRKSGQLDWEIEQGRPYLFKRLELKRGKNKPTDAQVVTIDTLTNCGNPSLLAWTLSAAVVQLRLCGFRFSDNLQTKLQFYEAQLEAWDREAELTKAGAAPRKRTAQRKAVPRNSMTAAQYHKAHGRGLV